MLDLDGISYAILDRCQNSIGNWFPQLANAIFYSDFFQLPKTKIMKVPLAGITNESNGIYRIVIYDFSDH